MLIARQSISIQQSKTSTYTIQLIDRERVDRIVDGDEQMLLAVDHVRLRRVGDAADSRVPEDLAGRGVERDEVAVAVSSEKNLPRRCQQTGPAAAVTRPRMTPHLLTGLWIHRDERVSARADRRRQLAAQTH